MGQPAARITDMHTCPMVTGTVPHVGGPIVKGMPTVLTCLMPQARVGDIAICTGPPDTIVKGSATVLVGGSPAARLGDMTVHGGVIVSGAFTVLIGDMGAGGGGGGMGGPGLFAEPAQQAKTLVAAARSGAPFCEICTGAGEGEDAPSTAPEGLIGSAAAKALAAVGDAWKKGMAALGGGKPVPGDRLKAAVAAVNPKNSTINCGHIIDAVAARLRGTNPNAVAPATQDGSFPQIEQRFGTKLKWGSSFDDAFKAVKKGGPGTMAVVGIGYSGGTASHVVLLANDGGVVGIAEAQNWGAGNPQEVITDVARANKRYNPDGGSNIGWGIVP